MSEDLGAGMVTGVNTATTSTSNSTRRRWPESQKFPVQASQGYVFQGLKVLDVGTWIAGPVATTVLADYGADVIKVEIPGAGDPYRQLPSAPATPDSQANYTWLLDARNKRSITLNLRTEEGKELLRDLIRECDVYVTNQPLPMRRRFGLTYEDLAPVNPRMIFASLTAYGEQGPDKDREGFDLVAYWSRTGLMDVVRAQGAEPAQSVPGMGDHPTAVALYASIVTALLRRQQTGEGGLVHTSLVANGLWSASCIAQAKFTESNFDSYQHPQKMPITRALYVTSDQRWLNFTMVRTPEEIHALLEMTESLGLLERPEFSTPELRFENGGSMVVELRKVFAQQTSEYWVEAFAKFEVPGALVGVLDDLVNDPQLKINNMLVEPKEPVGADWVINHPVNVETTERRGVYRAPEVGEHNHEVLAALGLTADQIRGLSDAGII